jgi:hypothetical protein
MFRDVMVMLSSEYEDAPADWRERLKLWLAEAPSPVSGDVQMRSHGSDLEYNYPGQDYGRRWWQCTYCCCIDPTECPFFHLG